MGRWESQPLAAVERLRARQDLASIAQLSTQIAEVEAELARLSTQGRWAEMVPFLIEVPGVALVTAMTVLSAIGDISRFASAKHLVGYSGLGARVHASGKTNRSGGISKQGRRELRAVLIEAAHAAKASSPLWRRRFERLATHIGAPKATVAIAGKLLVIIWYLLTRQHPDHDADAVAVARKLLRWGTKYGLATRQGLSRTAFVRDKLDQNGVGQDLEELISGGYRYDLRGLGPAHGVDKAAVPRQNTELNQSERTER